MTIAGFATGCEHGYLYLRGEYPLAWERLVAAITSRAPAASWATTSSGGRSFDIELRKGAGAYICGEETALFNSIEGYRGEPRNKPPFPVDEGVRQADVVNNVETLINVPAIVIEGGEAYAADRHRGLHRTGSSACRADRAPGPLRGAVRRHAARAGGARRRRARRPAAAGDPARRRRRAVRHARRARRRDVVRGTREAGVRMGSGVVMVIDDTVDLPAILMRLAAFFRDESCGSACPAGSARCARRRRSPAWSTAAARLGRAGVRADGRDHGLDARRVDLRPRQTAADAIESALRKLDVFETGAAMSRTRPALRAAPSSSSSTARRSRRARGRPSCRSPREGIEIPTMCWERTLTPVNACRVCVVR